MKRCKIIWYQGSENYNILVGHRLENTPRSLNSDIIPIISSVQGSIEHEQSEIAMLSPEKNIRRLLDSLEITHIKQYFNAICKLPLLGTAEMGKCWSDLMVRNLDIKKRHKEKWYILLELLIKEKLVEKMKPRNAYKRYFRTFKIKSDL